MVVSRPHYITWFILVGSSSTSPGGRNVTGTRLLYRASHYLSPVYSCRLWLHVSRRAQRDRHTVVLYGISLNRSVYSCRLILVASSSTSPGGRNVTGTRLFCCSSNWIARCILVLSNVTATRLLYRASRYLSRCILVGSGSTSPGGRNVTGTRLFCYSSN